MSKTNNHHLRWQGVQVGTAPEQPTHATSVSVEDDVEAAQALRRPVTTEATTTTDEVIGQFTSVIKFPDERAMSMCTLALI